MSCASAIHSCNRDAHGIHHLLRGTNRKSSAIHSCNRDSQKSYQDSHGIHQLLRGANRKSHRQNSGWLNFFQKYSRDSVPPYLQLAVIGILNSQ